jgi:hypothetical protein
MAFRVPVGEPARACAARQPFHPAEDALLMQVLSAERFQNWECVAEQLPGRTARQCRERWANYLCPQVRTGPWTRDEDDLLIAQLAQLGHAWTAISRCFHGRSDNDIKNRWYSHLRYETVCDRGRLMRAPRVALAHRRKRQRAVVDPKANALRLLAGGAPPREAAAECPAVAAAEEIAPWFVGEIGDAYGIGFSLGEWM